MRSLAVLVAVPLLLGCARQSAFPPPSLPSAEPLEVRLFAPTGDALNYSLSEPAYVAIFSVTRGHGIGLVYPFLDSQEEHRGHAGLNQEVLHRGTAGQGTGASAEQLQALFGRPDAYVIIASKEPLRVEGMARSPFLLRDLIGAEAFRAATVADAQAALEALLVTGLADADWASDLHLILSDPFAGTR